VGKRGGRCREGEEGKNEIRFQRRDGKTRDDHGSMDAASGKGATQSFRGDVRSRE
jgi:hypothetical protein